MTNKLTKAEQYKENLKNYHKAIEEYKKNTPNPPDPVRLVISWNPYSGADNFALEVDCDSNLLIKGEEIRGCLSLSSADAVKMGKWLVETFSQNGCDGV